MHYYPKSKSVHTYSFRDPIQETIGIDRDEREHWCFHQHSTLKDQRFKIEYIF